MDHGNELPDTTATAIRGKPKREVELMLYTIEKRIGGEDWEARVASLQQLQGLVLGGEAHGTFFLQTLGMVLCI